MPVEIDNESGASVDELLILGAARHVLGELGVHPRAELYVRLVDLDSMERLHVQYMDEPGPTDVLAFPMDELNDAGPGDIDENVPPALLGDVVLCPEVAARQAPTAGHGTQEELELLCTHGVLHLLGYDHGDEESQREMFELQTRLLESWRVERRRA